MTYPSSPGPQPPGGWNDPTWSSGQPGGPPDGQPGGHADPTLAMGGQPVSGQPVSGYPAAPVSKEFGAGYSPQPVSGDFAVGYPPPPGGYPAGGYPAYGYPPVVAAPPTNGMAIASMVVSIVGVLGLCGYGLGGYIGVVGAVLGHVAKRQIRERGEAGDGMALAGIILGWIAAALAVIATVVIIGFVIWAANTDPSTFE